jgi:hypothetical protein
MAGINYATQYVTQLGHLKMEIGYVASGDITAAVGIASGDLSHTHCVPTTLTHVANGWLVCSSTAGGSIGCLTGTGPINCFSSGDNTVFASNIDFTMDVSCTGGAIGGGGGDFYLIFGW